MNPINHEQMKAAAYILIGISIGMFVCEIYYHDFIADNSDTNIPIIIDGKFYYVSDTNNNHINGIFDYNYSIQRNGWHP